MTPELAGFIAEAQRISAQGDHLFDPGIGRLVALWGFQSEEFLRRPARPLRHGPPGNTPRRRLPICALRAARSAAPNVRSRLDFGGYRKGVALDRRRRILREAGIANALINIGGNVMALGSKHGEPWRVGIQHPRQPGRWRPCSSATARRSAPREITSASSNSTASATAICSIRAVLHR